MGAPPTTASSPPRAVGTPVGRVPRRAALERLGRLLGPALGATATLVGRVRMRPLHPDGLVLAGRLHRSGVPEGGRASGVPWLDLPGTDDVVVRLSRGGGLPRRLPDVHGIAFSAHDGDLLLSTAAGPAPGLRHVPFPRRRHGDALYSSLLAFEGGDGLVMIGARPRPRGGPLPVGKAELAAELRRSPFLLDLVWATPSSRWQRFGVLACMTAPGLATDRGVRFDPLRTPPGLGTQPWVRSLRGPAYEAARRPRPIRGPLRRRRRTT